MMSSSKTKGRSTMKRFFRFLYDTWYGALVCWCVTGVVLLLVGAIIGAKRDLAWLVNGLFVLQAAMSVLLVAAFVAALLRRRWAWALWQCLCGLMAGVAFIVALLFVSVGVMFSQENMEQFKAEEQEWRSSGISREVPFAIEFRDSHPFLAEYDRRITFQSGKHIGLWPDTGGAGAFAVYALGTNQFYLVDGLEHDFIRTEYRIDVSSETVECRCGEFLWMQVPDNTISITGRSEDDLSVKTITGDVTVTVGKPVGDSLKSRRFIGKIGPSGKFERGWREPTFPKKEEAKWVSAGFTEEIPFAYGWSDAKSNNGRSRIEFKSGRTVGLGGDFHKSRQNVYRLKNGMFLLVGQEGSFWKCMYRIDVTNEVVFCTYDGRWVRVPEESLGIRDMTTEAAHDGIPERTAVGVTTAKGRIVVYGDERIGRPLLGCSYVGCLNPDGSVVRVIDPAFKEALAQTRVLGADWNVRKAYERFMRLYKEVFTKRQAELGLYMENSADWVVEDEEDHKIAYRTFQSGDEACAVRLNLNGISPKCKMDVKKRFANPDAGCYAASLALIAEFEKIK